MLKCSRRFSMQTTSKIRRRSFAQYLKLKTKVGVIVNFQAPMLIEEARRIALQINIEQRGCGGYGGTTTPQEVHEIMIKIRNERISNNKNWRAR